ncbi:MAG: hemolysin III family protein [Spirochaetes bacterium]|nr:hemolysin III family protein [Spirochaetota bacterium]
MKRVQSSEKISFYTHLAGLFLSFIAIIPFIGSPYLAVKGKVSSIIFIFSIGLMFLASSVYHYTKKNENTESIWRKLDHMAIFIAIAGTYTPYCYIYLDGYWRWSIIILQWAFAIAGIIFKLFFLKAPRKLYTALYLAMGWVAIIPLKQLITAMPVSVTLLMFGGGIFYTIGAVIYARKKPNPKPGFFGFHEIFHIFIIIAAITHYTGVYISVF